MLNRELEFTLNLAFNHARSQRHEFMTVEHLLLALLDNSAAANVLRATVDDSKQFSILREELTNFVNEATPRISENDSSRETQPTLGFQRVLQRAVFHVQSSGKKEVSGANVLAAIFSEQESQAVYFLKKANVTRLDVVNYISHGIGKEKAEHTNPLLDEMNSDALAAQAPRPNPSHQEFPDVDPAQFGTSHGADTNPLESYATNLNRRAEQGLIDPLIGRCEETDRTIQVLCRRRKNNPLLVGEAGVGKTAIAEGLARMIVEGRTPEALEDHTVYALDLGALLAGTKYRGDFEKRFKSVLQQIKDQEKSILFIDEIHTIIGAGAASGGVMDASNLIKPMLSNGDLKCIGSTTYQEYRGIFEKDHAFARRFQKIDITEPTVDETVDILLGLKSRFEEHHHVKYTKSAIRSAAELSARYLSDRFLPDKAIDVMDEAGAFQALVPADKRKTSISTDDIEAIISKMARIPAKTVSRSDKEMLKNLDHELKDVVFGQDEAINALATAIKMSRSGLREDFKPVGSFLFAGPTGVGKTEVTRQLAEVLGVELIRFDMSEYMERHTVSRLIGAPPGYVGYDEGGLLTEAVVKQPHAVLLLDEIEKAHTDVFNLLLQVMDNGFLTDTNGRKADFRHIILVMTTNAGAETMARHTVGFTQHSYDADANDAIKHIFSPEFRNRLDAVIQFNPLNMDTILRVVDKFVHDLEVQLASQQVYLRIDKDARTWLAEHGYDAAMGARPMARLIQEKLKKPLAEELLFGKLTQGGQVRVKVKKDDIALSVLHEDTSAAA